MTYCPSCGSAFEEEARFCSYCGAKADGEIKTLENAPPPPPPETPRHAPVPVIICETAPPKGDTPISAWGYFGWLLLFTVPVIGWLFFLLAVCGAFGNRHVTALSRGFLLFVLLGVVAAMVLLILFLLIPWSWGVYHGGAWQWNDWGDWWRQIPWNRW